MIFVEKSSDKINDYKSVSDYEIYEKEYTDYNNEKQPFIVKYPQISGLDNKDLEDKINQTLKESITEWINENCDWVEMSEIVVKYKTSQYLSLCYVVEWANSPKNGFMRIGITVDMKTGDRVYLNDLIKDTDSLKQTLVKYNYEGEFSPPIESEEADSIIHYTSISETGYLEEQYEEDTYVYDFISSYLTSKPSFYLTDDKLVITRDENEMDDVIIDFNK